MRMLSWCLFCRSESHPPQAEKWLRPSASHSEETPGNIPKDKPVIRKERVSCEANSIGATGAKPPLLARTNICVGTRTGQPVLSYTINGSDYAGLPSSLLCPYQIVTIVDGQIQKGENGEIPGNPQAMMAKMSRAKNK